MIDILRYFDGSLWHSVVTTLFHTLWQAPLIGVAMFLILRRIPAKRSQFRYGLGLAALASVLLVGLITHGVLVETARRAIAPHATADMAGLSPATIQEGGTEFSSGIGNVSPLVSPGAQTDLSPSKPQGADARHEVALDWKPIAMIAWLFGVAIMLVRTGIGLIVLKRWTTRGSTHAVPESVTRAVDSLAAAMQFTRRIRVVLTDRLKNPAVIGVIWPTILMPPATLLGLTSEQLRIVLAHELAHIRRHDYLINLVQKLIEALLFFNPGVWWISRQVRIEREACCDELAARIVGDRQAVVRVLYDVAASMSVAPSSASNLAPAFAGDEKDSTLVNRIRRIVRPGDSPAMRMPWYSFALLAVAVLAGIWLASQGVSSAVQIVAQVLDGPKHIKRIEEIETSYGEERRRLYDVDKPIQELGRLSGTVRTHDGKPLPNPTTGSIRSEYQRGVSAYGLHVKPDGTWQMSGVNPGDVVVAFSAVGYAPDFYGPFRLKRSESKEGIDLVLAQGFDMKLRLLDEHDAPIAGVPIELSLELHDTRVRRATVHTDEHGVATVADLVECKLLVETTRPGYERLKETIDTAEGETKVIRLIPSRPVTGRVLSAITGKPLPGAEARMIYRSNPGYSCNPRSRHEREKPPFAVADVDGRFLLDSLESGSTYTFWFEAPGHRPAIVYGVAAGKDELTVQLESPIVVTAEVIGPLDMLPRNKDGLPQLRYSQGIQCSAESSHGSGGTAVVEVKDGKQIAVFDDLILPGSLTIRTPEQQRDALIENAADAGHVTVDLRPEAKVATRTVMVKLIPPEGWPKPTGWLRVDYVEPGSNISRQFDLDIEAGQVSIDVPLNESGFGRFTCGQLISPGYWIEESRYEQTQAGEDPHIIEIPIHPAGSVFGTVVDADGNPYSGASVRLNEVEQPTGRAIDSDHLQAKTGADGRFALTLVPLDGTYIPTVSDYSAGLEKHVYGDEIEINAQSPTHEIRLEMPKGVDVPVQVVGPDGAPVPGAQINLNHQTGTSGFGGMTHSCDSGGRHTFKGVNFDVPGTYSIIARPTATLAGTSVEIDSSSVPVTISLSQGCRLVGVLINQKTGEPISGRIVSARPVHGSDVRYTHQIEAGTDDKGKFVFQNLAQGTYRLNAHRTAPSNATVVRHPDGTLEFQYKGKPKDDRSVKVPRESDAPFELRVVPY
ncbi:MAG: hypothetical protein DHS20C16_10470 [Phycisphaerae bacterium]|nr:MAG: hypothetical protein DHS20C16_10470 [Phycisphaerae bacterium]